MAEIRKPRIGIALGGGSARGWAHIGILQELANMGIHPDIACGCSSGSIVAAAYAAGHLEQLETSVTALTKLELMRFFELNMTLNGFVRQERLKQFLHDNVCARETLIEELTCTFAAVATNLNTGHEVWFTEGPALDAIWASIALPGLFPPYQFKGQWLVDGGLVNPVPVSLCRALGADVVIAVNLNSNALSRIHADKLNAAQTTKSGDTAMQITEVTEPTTDETTTATALSNSFVSSVATSLWEYSSAFFTSNKSSQPPQPNLIDAIAGSINIMQDKVTRSRMAGDPPDILLNPRMTHIGLLEFYRAGEAIEEGRECVKRMSAEIDLLNG